MGAVGADVGQLRDFSRSLNRRAELIEGLLAKLDPVVRDMPWVGADRDRFVEEWQQVHHKGLLRLALDLRTTSTSCNQHADRQEQASRAGHGSW
ncbi:MAG TPA: hypothetical protein GXZ30_02740 [Propionibacterium sp.]|jgi:uncharacterized protein YukE|nr:hypothetical protein [Propionibacterium sp.]